MKKSKIPSARELSMQALKRVEEEGAFLNLALAEVIGGQTYDPREKRLATEITYGVTSYKLTIDWLIEQVSGRTVKKIDKEVLSILRIGFYQLFYLSRVPAPAACNTTVELVKTGKKKGLAPFVNGVMRGALRKKEQLPWPKRAEDEAGYLSLVYSHPRWMVERWLKRFGSGFTEELLAANNRPSPMVLRTNTLKTTRKELLHDLEEAGYNVTKSEVSTEGIVVQRAAGLTGLAAYREGLFYIQGESSMLTSQILNPMPGGRVLDCCSAPGGKATHIAQLMKNRGEIVCLDIYPHRLTLIEANCRRLGVKIVKTICADAKSLTTDCPGEFKCVLVDAPCSGIGVLRKKPDLKWRRQPEDITAMAREQAAMLREAASVVSVGGVLLYSTCTNELEETENIIETFLAQNQQFSLDDISSQLSLPLQGDDQNYGIHLYPHKHGLDGFFICRLKRIK